MGERVELRRLGTGDRPVLRSLRESASAERADLDALHARDRWRLERGGAVAMGAFAGERLLGIVAARPRLLRAGEAVVPVAEVGPVLVDPAYLGRGVERVLHDELVATLARREVEAIACVPDIRAGLPPAEGAGYERAVTVLSTLHPLRRDRLPRPSPDVDIEHETVVGADYDGLDADLASGETATVRSAEYLRRRYLTHPAPYELLSLRRGRRLEGWLVVLAVPRDGDAVDGWIVDSLLWPDPAVRRSGHAAAVRWFAGQGCRRVLTARADTAADGPVMPDRPDAKPRRLDYLVRPIRSGGRILFRSSIRARWVFRPGEAEIV